MMISRREYEVRRAREEYLEAWDRFKASWWIIDTLWWNYRVGASWRRMRKVVNSVY